MRSAASSSDEAALWEGGGARSGRPLNEELDDGADELAVHDDADEEGEGHTIRGLVNGAGRHPSLHSYGAPFAPHFAHGQHHARDERIQENPRGRRPAFVRSGSAA